MIRDETPILLDCAGAKSIAIVHAGRPNARLGVVVIVGGPQYRVGSHRQFTLLARALAGSGVPVIRFDHSGIGDSGGEPVDFESIQGDINSAVDALIEHTGVDEVILWGLCDAASAALMYAPSDKRIRAMILLNPWVHTEEMEARVRLRSYYLSRLRSREFWSRLVRFEFDWKDSLSSLLTYVKRSFAPATSNGAGENNVHFIERMRRGLAAFNGEVYLALSGQDMTADEFRKLIQVDARWSGVADTKITETVDLPEANHTFAARAWRERIEQQSVEWVKRTEQSINP